MKKGKGSLLFILHAVFLLSFCACKSTKDLKEIKISHPRNEYMPVLLDYQKKQLTKKEIKEFERGLKLFYFSTDKPYYVKCYEIDSTRKYLKWEGATFGDGALGKRIEYYPNGNICKSIDYVVIDKKTNEIIPIEKYNINYQETIDGKCEYFSEDGKPTKTEIYDKGKLIKTITY